MATPKPKARNVADLKSSILRPALTSTYECHFNIPSSALSLMANWMQSRGLAYDAILKNDITLSCREASLPGTSLATHEQFNDFTGITERHVYRRQYDTTASFSFYVDHDYKIINFFENYIAFIVNESNNQAVETSNYSYRVNFPQQYKTEIFIRKFERDYEGNNLVYKFLNAYPISINQMSVNYDNSQILLCTVNFNFSRYVIVPPGGFAQTTTLSEESLPEEQQRSSVIRDSTPQTFGNTNGQGSDFVERDTATGARMDGGADGPLLLPDGSPVRNADGSLREMF